MTSSEMSMELSVSFVSWINDQIREQVETRDALAKSQKEVGAVRRFVVAGVACISFALASIIAT